MKDAETEVVLHQRPINKAGASALVLCFWHVSCHWRFLGQGFVTYIESAVGGGGIYITHAIYANCTVGTYFCLHLEGPAKSLSQESLF